MISFSFLPSLGEGSGFRVQGSGLRFLFFRVEFFFQGSYFWGGVQGFVLFFSLTLDPGFRVEDLQSRV